MDLGREVAKKLLQINAIKLNAKQPFTWASGLRSPIYCDNRISLSYPSIRSFIKNGLASLSNEYKPFDIIAGVATAGIPHAALLADHLNLPLIYVRSQAKAHGRQNQIEGFLEPGKRVLVIEDLISTGKSSLNAIQALENAGAKLCGLIAIFSYEFSIAKNNFESNNISFKTLSSYSSLLQEAKASNYISENENKILENWNADPSKWSENFNKSL